MTLRDFLGMIKQMTIVLSVFFERLNTLCAVEVVNLSSSFTTLISTHYVYSVHPSVFIPKLSHSAFFQVESVKITLILWIALFLRRAFRIIF